LTQGVSICHATYPNSFFSATQKQSSPAHVEETHSVSDELLLSLDESATSRASHRHHELQPGELDSLLVLESDEPDELSLLSLESLLLSELLDESQSQQPAVWSSTQSLLVIVQHVSL
jgi:hypothetical protein